MTDDRIMYVINLNWVNTSKRGCRSVINQFDSTQIRSDGKSGDQENVNKYLYKNVKIKFVVMNMKIRMNANITFISRQHRLESIYSR